MPSPFFTTFPSLPPALLLLHTQIKSMIKDLVPFCPPLSPLHTLLPLTKAVLPSSHRLTPNYLPLAFHLETNPRGEEMPAVGPFQAHPSSPVCSVPCSAPLSSIRSTAKQGQDPAA